jgi:hypothetical protein
VPQTTATQHDERLWFGPVGWITVLLGAISLGAVLAPVDGRLGLGLGVLALVVGVLVGVLTTARVQVRDGELVAGRAHVPVRLLAAPQTLDRDRLTEELGPRLDARMYGCVRSWIAGAVRVELRDPQDPTPYWIVSTRRPDDLVRALRSAGASER